MIHQRFWRCHQRSANFELPSACLSTIPAAHPYVHPSSAVLPSSSNLKSARFSHAFAAWSLVHSQLHICSQTVPCHPKKIILHEEMEKLGHASSSEFHLAAGDNGDYKTFNTTEEKWMQPIPAELSDYVQALQSFNLLQLQNPQMFGFQRNGTNFGHFHTAAGTRMITYFVYTHVYIYIHG